jgi:nucleotide-binding universal stress UspA family protein
MDSRDYGALRPHEPQTPHGERAIRVIAAATDFTTTATVALRRAGHLCRANGARMHLIHVMSPAGAKAGSMLNAISGRRLGASVAISHLRQAAGRIIAEFDVPVDTHLGVGDLSREIGAYARAARADLIVVGNSRKNFLEEVLGLNTALRVQRKTDFPLLAVSSPALRPYTRVLLASDLSAEAARAGQRALRFFPDSMFVVLHAYESPYTGMLAMTGATQDVLEDYRRRARLEGMERLHTFARDASLDKHAILRVDLGHPALSARRQATELGIDLVVLRPTKRWLTSGVTEHLIADPPCDLLLMP